jgi:hypothetical protein
MCSICTPSQITTDAVLEQRGQFHAAALAGEDSVITAAGLRSTLWRVAHLSLGWFSIPTIPWVPHSFAKQRDVSVSVSPLGAELIAPAAVKIVRRNLTRSS